MDQPVEFALVEPDKENIQHVKQGRSIKALAENAQLTKDGLSGKLALERDHYAAQLEPEHLQQLDDPLEPYLEYLKWIRESFPAGNNKSELIQLLERATHDFKDDDYYKNEVRYFKVWLEYIKFSDSPRDVYAYLHKKQIGCKLSLFYESYAGFLEGESDYVKADEIFKIGLESKARPVAKLEKAYSEFAVRKESHQETGQEVVGLINTEGGGLNLGVQSQPQHSGGTEKRKFAVFQDDAEPQQGSIASKRDSLDSILNSKKENKIHATPFGGQKLPQENTPAHLRSFSVFQDVPAPTYPVTKTVKTPGKRTVKYDYNFELFFPEDKEPRTLYEVLALMRGNKKRRISLAEILATPKKSRLSTTPSRRSSGIVLALNEEGDTTKLTQSPTLTFFSKEARKDVLQMFNQPLDLTTSIPNEDNTTTGLSDFVTETLVKSKEDDEESLASSLFQESPLRISFGSRTVDPFDSQVRKQVLAETHCEEFGGYHPNAPDFDTQAGLCVKRGRQYTVKHSADHLSLLWEFCVLSEIAGSSNNFEECEIYCSNPESFLLLPNSASSTLSRLIGKGPLSELMVAYLAIQALRHVIELHILGFLHCNISAETCTVSFSETIKNKVLSFKDVLLSGFENAINTSKFGEKVTFKTGGEEWRYEKDYRGLAGVIHSLLNLCAAPAGTTMWGELFTSLESTTNATRELQRSVGRLEAWIQFHDSGYSLLEEIKEVNGRLN